MAVDSKVVYLKREDGASIKAYVVDYLFDTKTDKEYVIVVDQTGKNAKGYQIVGGEAVILSIQDSSLFRGYKTNPDFRLTTLEHKDGETFELVREAKKKEKILASYPIIYYVFDYGSLRSYKADYTVTDNEKKILSNILFAKSWENVSKEDINQIVASMNHEEEVYIIYDKLNDLEFNTDKTMTVLNWVMFDKNIDFSESVEEKTSESMEVIATSTELVERKEIVFYVLDQNIAKKYKGILKNFNEEQMTIGEITALGTIDNLYFTNEADFLASNQIEIGSYLVTYDNYDPSVEINNGKPGVVATLSHYLEKKEIILANQSEEIISVPSQDISLQNSEEIIETSAEEVETPVDAPEIEFEDKKNPYKVVVFSGNVESSDNRNRYSIWGSICTVLSSNPLTLVPEKNGVKTIHFENESAKSIEELCQIYQNLYPTTPVYLLLNYEFDNGNIQILQPNDYKSFQSQSTLKENSLLENGRKVLTEEEMLKVRKQELETLKKKTRREVKN